MRPRLLPLLASGVLALTLLGPVTAVADDHGPAGPSLPEQAADAAEEHASEVLDEAQAILEGQEPTPAAPAEDHVDATLALQELEQVRDDLSPRERRQADALLARPTDKWGDTVNGGTFWYPPDKAARECSQTLPICVHYATGNDNDAPPDVDVDPANEVPDDVDETLAVAEQVHAAYVAAGYRRPKSDGDRGGKAAGLVDIYLADTGAAALYGYCSTDPEWSGRTRPAYCVVDNDFAEFAQHTPQENRQVTLAHEYFHAIQFAYDYWENPWFMEATATWAEDELFDDVDDNRGYLQYGQLHRPGIPLDVNADPHWYGNWIFFRYLTERFPAEPGELPRLVRDTWERAAPSDVASTAAIQEALAARGTSLTSQYGAFAAANRRPEEHYEEGEHYRASPVARRALGPRDRRTVSARLHHLTHRTFRFVPERTRRLAWGLRLDVDMPRRATSPVARLLTYRTNGDVTESRVRLSRSGDRTVRVEFSTRRIEGVELVLVNASRSARHDGLRTTVAARTYRG